MSEITVNEEGFRAEAETLINAALEIHWDELITSPQCTIPSVNYFAAVYEQLRTYVNAYSQILIRDVATITDIAIAFLQYDNVMANLSPYDHWFNTAPTYIDPSVASYESISPTSQNSSWCIDSDDLDGVIAEIIMAYESTFTQLLDLESKIRYFVDTDNFTGDAARASLLYFQRVHLGCCQTFLRCLLVLARCASHHLLQYRNNEDAFIDHFKYSEEQLNGIVQNLTSQTDLLQEIEPSLHSQTEELGSVTDYEFDYSPLVPASDEVLDGFSETVAKVQSILDRVEEYENVLVSDMYPTIDEMFSLLAGLLQSTIENARRYQYTYPPLPEDDPIAIDNYDFSGRVVVQETELYTDDIDDAGSRVDQMFAEDDNFLSWLRNRWNGFISHFEHDDVGIMLLDWYLRPIGDELYLSNPYMTAYMEEDEVLTCRTRRVIDEYIADPEHSLEIGESMEVNISVHMDMETGEGIVGYQYLHGTTAPEGDYQIVGTITRLSETSYGCQLTYTWNDEIDPNSTYDTDTSKNRIANIFSLGRCDSYKIHISWSDYSVIGYTEEDETSGWLHRPMEDYTNEVINVEGI